MPGTRNYLDMAALLALRAAGDVEPNPMVGAVIVRDGRVIGRGHHRYYGGRHAETEALADCRARGHDPRGATVYVTLEPCSHTGKQPPCTEALIEAGVARVVFARRDPNPVSAGGQARLASAGIACDLDASSVLATRLSDPFVKRVTTGLPWVIAKWAQTIDGWIATRSGESKWISGPAARWRVHQLRGRVDAVVTAIGTVLSDDPLLTARLPHPPRRVARRVVIDPQLEIPAESRLAQSVALGPVMVVTTEAALVRRGAMARRLADAGVEVVAGATDGAIPLADLLRRLVDQHEATNVLVEAGAGLLGRLLASDLMDEALVFIAPKLLGDDGAVPVARGRSLERLSDARQFTLGRVRQLGEDVMLRYFRRQAMPVEGADPGAKAAGSRPTAQ